MNNDLVDRLRMVFDEAAEIHNAALAGELSARAEGRIVCTEWQRRNIAAFARAKNMAYAMLHAASAQAAIDMAEDDLAKANATKEEVPHDSSTH